MFVLVTIFVRSRFVVCYYMFAIEGVVYVFADFEMTDAQYEHALAVDRLASSLAALRIELCPAYMSENCFWRIYFVLVHPKFSKEDALLLSTSQVSLVLNSIADHSHLFPSVLKLIRYSGL